MKKSERQLLANQRGFTLIEIIAVLVILGILAAVAVPKFIDLTEDAQDKALEGALAAGFSNVTLSYSKYVLQNGAAPTSILSGSPAFWTGNSGSNVEIETDLGDYTATYTKGSSDTQVQIVVTNDGGGGVSATRDFNLP